MGELEQKEQQEQCNVFCVDEQKMAQIVADMPEPRVLQALADTFKVLGDPSRIKILRALSSTEMCVCEIATLLNMSVSAVSHQLRLLRNMRLVKCRREGKMIHYSLDDGHIVNLFREGLEHVEHTL